MISLTKRPHLLIAGMVTALGALLILYSQTAAFAWDEGFHLLTAQSILRGKKPYLDFIFSQTPLNAYWNALWMRVFGVTWHTPHAVEAVLTTLAVWMTADYVLRRFPVEGWRLPAAIVTVFLVGMNVPVVEFGTIGQAYALCLFSIVAAFRLTVLAVDRGNLLLPAGAGFLASAAANSSLLTAPVGPVLLLWMMIYNRQGNRWLKFLVYGLAAILPMLPFLWLLHLGPRQTLFGVLDYNMKYRRLEWEGATSHDIEVMMAWLGSTPSLMLALLAIAGFWYLYTQSGWEHKVRAEFYLCAWLAFAEICHIASGHPNFARYYLFTAPFVTVLACAGLYWAGSKLVAPDRPRWPVAVVCVLMCLGITKAVFENRDDTNWYDMEEVAKKVNEVTPPSGNLLADELTYFLSRHPPYPGNELADSHKIILPPAEAAKVHLIPKPELERLIKAGTFDTIVTDDEEKRIGELGLRQLYRHAEEVSDYWIFWGKAK